MLSIMLFLIFIPLLFHRFHHSVKANLGSKNGKDVDLFWTAKDNNTIAERKKSKMVLYGRELIAHFKISWRKRFVSTNKQWHEL